MSETRASALSTVVLELAGMDHRRQAPRHEKAVAESDEVLVVDMAHYHNRLSCACFDLIGPSACGRVEVQPSFHCL